MLENEQKTELKMIKMSEIQAQEVKWLWYPFIPFGKLTSVQGDPGDGKTTMILNLAARLSKGGCFEEGAEVVEPMKVIYQTAEDGLADTVKPRIEKAGADCEQILVIDESDKSLSMIDERIEEALKTTGAKMLILDPIQAYLGGGMDMNRANEAREMTKRQGKRDPTGYESSCGACRQLSMRDHPDRTYEQGSREQSSLPWYGLH